MKNSNPSNRRDFLRTLSLGIGAMALTPALNTLAYGTALPANSKLGIALVGLGGYSTGQLAPALQSTSNCYLAGIVTGSPEKAASWSAKYNIPQKNIYNYENFDRIIDNPAIDIVYIVLPVSMHKEFTIRAAKAGKHVICEKPMALNAAECRDMIAACKQANRMLSIGYRLHFEPHHIEVMRLGQKEIYGKLKSLDASNGFTWGSKPTWRLKKAMSGGGALMDMGIYAIQASRYTTGQEPLFVTAREDKKSNPSLFAEVDDTIHWELEFPGGLVTTGKSSYSNNWSSLNVEAQKGKFELSPAYGYGGIAGKNAEGIMNIPNINQQAAQMDDFARCVFEKKATRVPGEEGLKDMKVIDAIYKGISSGKKEAIQI